MFKFKALLATAGATAMLTATTATAATNPAAGLSIAAPARAATATAHDSKLGAAVPTTTLISIGILAALIVVVLTVVADNNDSPNSP